MSDPIAKESVHTSFDLTTLSEADLDAAIASWLSLGAQTDYATRHEAALQTVARYGEDTPACDTSEA